MKDFLNKEINIGDEVIYLKRLMTGSSATRKIMFKGKVIAFDGKKVVIKREYTNEWEITQNVNDTIFPKDAVILRDVRNVKDKR